MIFANGREEHRTLVVGISRRNALARLGFLAGIAYTAPSVLHLDRSANARIVPTPCPPPDGICTNNPPTCPC